MVRVNYAAAEQAMKLRILVTAWSVWEVILLGTAQAQQSGEWHTYRHDQMRSGEQPVASALSDPSQIGTLSVKWGFPAEGPGIGDLRASPIVANDTVYIGSRNGYFYALDAATGALKWQYPTPPAPPLVGQDPMWRTGIQSSASYWQRTPGADGVVIFGAQDPTYGPVGPNGTYGVSRLYMLDAVTGALIGKSDPVAQINGDTVVENTGQPRQRIGLSSPLLFNEKAYIGVYGFSDKPVGVGRVIAVGAGGHIVPGFNFQSVGTAASPPGVFGGAVWNSPATDGTGVYFTTGNVRCDNSGNCQRTEPTPDNALSLIRVDKDTGNIIWGFHPIPFVLDSDDDWGAGATVMPTSCGTLIASVQKDGWAYAVDAGDGTPGAANLIWQFPPTGFGNVFLSAPHRSRYYAGPGAAWGTILVISAGGEALVHDGPAAGWGRLHAINVCAPSEQTRVRWIADIEIGQPAEIGAPTVTHGIVYIGGVDKATNTGHLFVLADPSVAPPAGSRCSNIDYTTAADCTAAGYVMVPIPQILADVVLPDGGAPQGTRSEPVLANGRVFVGTNAGHVYMLAP